MYYGSDRKDIMISDSYSYFFKVYIASWCFSWTLDVKIRISMEAIVGCNGIGH